MEFLENIKKPYQAVLDEKWEDMEKYYNDISAEDPMMGLGALLSPISVDRDTAFHLAVYSGGKQPLCHLLELVEKNGAGGILSVDEVVKQNSYGNTFLHEAAIRGNIEAVEILVAKFPQLVKATNEFGETPLFRAAAFGKRRIVKYLASQPGQLVLTDNGEKHLKNIHRQREDGTSILHAAVQGEHFGTALQLLELDEELANLKYDNGTSLYMLANTPSLFKRGCEMNIFKKLLYICLPVGNYLNEDAETNSGQNFCRPKDIPIDDTENIVEVKNGETNSGRNDNGCLAKGLPVGNDLNKDAEYKVELKIVETNSGQNNNGCCLSKDIPIDDTESIEVEVSRNDNGYLSKGRRMWTIDYGEVLTSAYTLSQISNRIYLTIRRLIIGGCPTLSKLWTDKRYNKFARDLAVKLIEKDKSWEQSIIGSTSTLNEADKDKLLEQKNTGSSTTSNEAAEDKPDTNNDQEKKKEEIEKDRSPLFAATRTGNVELVKMILKEHPQALEYKNSKKQNILHVAVKYRQKEIFKYVKTIKVPMLRLVRQTDADGYTVLHSVADTKHYNRGTRSGPAYNLQEELEWFSNVEKLIPSHYKTLRDNKDKTAKELLKEMHEKQLENAQKWIKETSQSCSGVAVLVSTVVFAAAFTVPGGTNDSNGRPILLHSPFFLFFTVMDVISLSCSLTSVVMFLSIVTSPFELDDFLVSLPRRLTLGFALLFMSVATTMLAFTSTIVLIIHLGRRQQWTVTLICSAAFFPVSVLALTHFPLFVSFLIAWKNLFLFVWDILPCSLVLSWLKNLAKTTCKHPPTTIKGKYTALCS